MPAVCENPAIASLMGSGRAARFTAPRPVNPPIRDELYDLMPSILRAEYDIRDVLGRLVDGSAVRRVQGGVRPDPGMRLCADRRLGRRDRGQSEAHVREPGRPLEFGGVIYAEAADKAARFIMDCNQNLVPLIFLHDVNGFMVGRRRRDSGIISRAPRW